MGLHESSRSNRIDISMLKIRSPAETCLLVAPASRSNDPVLQQEAVASKGDQRSDEGYVHLCA